MAGRCPRLLELERSLPVDKERQMVRAGREKQQEKRQTLEFRVKFGVWQKPAETNDPHIGDSAAWFREVSPLGELMYAIPGFQHQMKEKLRT